MKTPSPSSLAVRTLHRTPRRGVLFMVVAVAAAALFTGCAGPSASLTAPDGFAELEHDTDYSFRATNASGVVIGIRTEKNEPAGNLAFWTEALDNKLRSQGYVALDDKPLAVKTDDGRDGNRLRYQLNRNGRNHEYWLTVFVAGESVVVVEAAGDEAYFNDAIRDELEAATRTMKLG
ncbi:MAG: hypothetical protein U0271_45750 [Polyangiaceae bacterium]